MTQASWRQGPVFLLVTLTLVNTNNWADRQVVPILVPSIKGELQLSDTELGLIGGLAFSLIYSVSAFLFGFLADRRSRRAVITFGLVCWSVGTAASGMAHSFWALFAARFVTGFGEASLYPCAMSLIADAFPVERRGSAIGLVGASTALGGGLGIGLGGWLVQHAGWREVFLLYGASGLLVLPLLLVLKEPARAEGHDKEAHDPPARIIGKALRDVRLLAVWATGFLILVAATGWITWAPTYFNRDLGFDIGETGVVFGIAQLFGGVIGSIVGGRLGDKWRKKSFAGQLKVTAFFCLISLPMVSVALLDVPRAVLMFGAVMGPFTIFAALPSLQSMVVEIVPARRLGLTFAVHMLFLAGFGAATGPFVVGWLSDATGSLRTALGAPIVAIALSAFGAWIAAAFVRARTPERAA